MAPENFIEVSFEVANKVGGIHQVLKSKAGEMQKQYGDNYITVGFYNEEKATEEFAPREDHNLTQIFEKLEEKGIKCYYGVWSIPEDPKCILVDATEMEKPIDEIKKELWEEYGINSINAGQDFDEPVKWSYAVAELVKELKKNMEGETVLQAHEWLSGPAILKSDLPSVFTTHATVLGRTLSSSDYDLVEAVEKDDISQKLAEKKEVESKHQVEKASAEQADVFTTVSKNTGQEAEAVLNVKPDKILPNGFNVEDFPSLEELSYQHKEKKETVKEFLRAYFKPYYDVDLDNDPRILFTSGRYEYHNKGLDVFIESLSKINKREGDDVFVFILVPSDIKQQKMEVVENVSLYKELESYIDSIMPDLKKKLLNEITSGQDAEKRLDLVEKGENELKSLQENFRAKQGDKPPVSAFDLNYPEDEILTALYQNGIRNREDDRVKVVFYPTYLSVGDRMLSMSYNDFLVASSAGIFPSYYEPWGYTPVETAANGALSVTTDMAGFGKFLLENTEEENRKGIKILERENKTEEEAAEQLSDVLEEFLSYSKTEITERKHNARRLAQLTSWEKLSKNYLEAHKMAISD